MSFLIEFRNLREKNSRSLRVTLKGFLIQKSFSEGFKKSFLSSFEVSFQRFLDKPFPRSLEGSSLKFFKTFYEKYKKSFSSGLKVLLWWYWKSLLKGSNFHSKNSSESIFWDFSKVFSWVVFKFFYWRLSKYLFKGLNVSYLEILKVLYPKVLKSLFPIGHWNSFLSILKSLS